jgi:C4-dicarboxylate transporter, DctQ subunit
MGQDSTQNTQERQNPEINDEEIESSMTIGNILTKTNHILAGLASTMIIMIMCITCAEVFSRYFIHKPLMWAVEITEYLQVYITFLAAAWVLEEDGHVRLDSILNALGVRSRSILGIGCNLLGLFTMAVIAWYSGYVTYQQFVLNTPVIKSLEIPKWVVLFPVPLGSSLIVFEFIRKLLHRQKA